MFKLPKCPHCGESYTSAEVKENLRNKTFKCKSCKKPIANKSFAGRLILIPIVIVLVAGIDCLLFALLQENGTVPSVIVTFVLLLGEFFLQPYVCKYEKIDDDEK